MEGLKSLLKSRKFLLAVFGVAQAVVLHYLQVPEELWQAITALIMVVIGGIAIEDAGAKSANVQVVPYIPEDDE